MVRIYHHFFYNLILIMIFFFYLIPFTMISTRLSLKFAEESASNWSCSLHNVEQKARYVQRDIDALEMVLNTMKRDPKCSTMPVEKDLSMLWDCLNPEFDLPCDEPMTPEEKEAKIRETVAACESNLFMLSIQHQRIDKDLDALAKKIAARKRDLVDLMVNVEKHEERLREAREELTLAREEHRASLELALQKARAKVADLRAVRRDCIASGRPGPTLEYLSVVEDEVFALVDELRRIDL
jgi:hypothetical protein